MLRQFRLRAVLVLALLASTGCGIKGPLVLPPAAPPQSGTSAPAAVAPATATTPAASDRKP